MDFFGKIKSALNIKAAPDTGDPDGEPQLGFKILYYQERKSVGVRVIAARNLPMNIGSAKPQGYLVKVKLFPGKEKFETKIIPSNCPSFDEHFMFPGISNMNQFAGKFITFTIYADLEGTSKPRKPLKTKQSFSEKINSIVAGSTEGDVKLRSKINRTEARSSDRFTLNNRRTIGAISYTLEKQIFTERGKGGAYYTPDIWRTVKDIGGKEIESRESKKGSLEVTMKYSNSEDGRNDMLQIALTKFRCSMATMQTHEKLGVNLYLKMATHEYDVVVSKWKGDTFQPTISMRIEKDSATMITTINNYNLDKTKIIIKLKSRNSLQQKTLLGTIIIDNRSAIFKTIVANPTIEDTQMIDFN